MENKKRVILNYCLIVMVIVPWLWMFFFGIGELSSKGLVSLRYFTVLSNLLAAAAAAVWLVLRRKGEDAVRKAETMKYVAATAVALTFTTVIVFLGPLYGYPSMFTGANLFFHGIVPVAAVLEVIFMAERKFDRRDNLLAVIPTAVYGVFYVCNVLINGRGEWPELNDFYMFFAWGNRVAAVIFVIMLAVTYMLGLLMRKTQRAGRKQKGESE